MLKGGKPVKIPGSPPHVRAPAYSGGRSTLSGGVRGGAIYAWSGWNGTRFAKSRVVVAPRKGFTAFNGIAMGPDGMLCGVSLGDKKTDDYSKGSTPYANDVVPGRPGALGRSASLHRGCGSRGSRSSSGHDGPVIADLGQENLGKKRPIDRVVEAGQGANFGFPSCPANPATSLLSTTSRSRCSRRISSPMGLGALGGKLYVALFGGTRAKGPRSCRCRSRAGSTHQLWSALPLRSCARRAWRQGVRRRPDRKHLQLHAVATPRQEEGVPSSCAANRSTPSVREPTD